MARGFRESVAFDQDCCLGGNEAEARALDASQPLEMNGVTFSGKDGKDFTLATLDALYPGALAGMFDPAQHIFCASHTHYAPMIDANKGLVGRYSQESCERWKLAFAGRTAQPVAFDKCQLLAARVPVHVYRRMDYPRHSLNRFLNARVGLFPNDGLTIDQQVYVWLFQAGSTPQFAMVYHAGHPVSRHSSLSISPDYVGVIRSAIREKWSDMPVLFLQGCGADLRPRIVGRRISRLPFFWLNKKFVAPPSSQQQAWVDDSYRTAIESLEVIDSFACKPSDVVLDSATVRLRAQGDIEYPVIRFGDAYRFDFLPFEVSHLFHLRERKHDKSRFLVSCCGDTIGYLPHPSQLLFGGYEVDGSRKYMNLEDRVEIQSADFRI